MRAAGILLPIFSLPDPYGIGGFSKTAYRFADFLASAHQTYWQLLPMGATGYGDSPYQTFSTFAGNPYFISLETLVDKGLLTKRECAPSARRTDKDSIDYGRLYRERFKVLRKAFLKSGFEEEEEYRVFEEKNADWLGEYALFMALKNARGGVSFTRWEEPLRLHKKAALEKAGKELSQEIRFQKFLQYEFYSGYMALKKYANSKGIKIIGDIPIYVSPDSSDLWASPELFQLSADKTLKAVAGCPPDAFSADGQLWGNPLYDWKKHEETGFDWWIRRMRKCLELFDVVRIDHFRGFDSYYSIPFGDKTAKGGHWEKGPGIALFKAMKESLGEMNVIAEDLGMITDSVRALVKRTGFPNMKVLEFAFDASDRYGTNEYLPHRYSSNCVVYTGTHDNETLSGWIKSISPKERKAVFEYLDLHSRNPEKLCYALIRLALSSVADTAVIPMQDYLCLDNSARMNLPSTLGGNWVWRMSEGAFGDELAAKIRSLTDMYGRFKPEKKRRSGRKKNTVNEK
ncbi:MAG: 4-alpha-glucanotransferase [Lachnospiraceae bacterium]|nr:4-alpha-glucanotransferase [Lachnospiraceae bacterium]